MIPLALPFSSVMIGALNVDSELPGIPVNLISGTTQRLIFLPSRNTNTSVLGFSLRMLNLTGMLRAKYCKELTIDLPPLVLVDTPLGVSLFCGLMLEELATDAGVTSSATISSLVLDRPLIL